MDLQCFYESRDEAFVATELTRGPWDNGFQHAGPPCALVTRALEREARERGFARVARLTFELVRPVPIAALRVAVSVPRAGRSAARLAATLLHDETPLVLATVLALREDEPSPVPATASAPLPEPSSCEPFAFPFFQHPVGYHTAMELRLARGEFGRTPTVMWMRSRVPLVADEPTSPLCRVVTVADSGNGVSPMVDWRTHSFVNADLTVAVHRDAEGDWLALDARTDLDAGGTGTAFARLHDGRGPVGYGIQSLLVRAAPGR